MTAFDAVLYFGDRRVCEVEVTLDTADDAVEFTVPSAVGLSLPADARLRMEDGAVRGLRVRSFETGGYQGSAFVRAWLVGPLV